MRTRCGHAVKTVADRVQGGTERLFLARHEPLGYCWPAGARLESFLDFLVPPSANGTIGDCNSLCPVYEIKKMDM